MRAISAVDSVSPAIQRTRDFLFRQFNWGTYLKLGLVALITEGLGSNFQSSSNHSDTSGHVPMLDAPFDLAPIRIAQGVAMLLLLLVFSGWIFYLITRLRFAFFHCLTTNTKLIRPGWHIYKEQATRFFWTNLAVGFCYLLVLALVAIPFISGFMRLVHETPKGGQPDWTLVLSLVLPLIPIVFLLFVAAVLADIVLRDWLLPHFALDNATAGQAWSRVWASFMAEKRQFIAYILLRLVLPLLAAVCLFVVLLIPGLVLAGSVAAVELGLHSAFADSTGASALVGTLLEVFFGILAFGFMLLASVCLGGPISTGAREYALVFYGGRYQPLGAAMQAQIARSA